MCQDPILHNVKILLQNKNGMKILIINSEYPPIGGGAGNASAYIARGLANLEHEVVVVTAFFTGQPRLEVQDGVTIYRIPSMRKRLDRSGVIEQIAFILSASKWAIDFVSKNKDKVEVSLAFFGIPSGVISWLLKKLFKIPYIVSLRGGDVPGFRPYDFKIVHQVMSPFLRVIWHDAGQVIANSVGLRKLASIFDASIEIPVIPNGVDVFYYSMPKRTFSIPQIFSVGRVVYQKGFDVGLRALAELKHLEWEWYIAGDGPQLQTLKSLANELGVSERVHFLGWQSRSELLQWYHKVNLFLLPSRHEGMSNAVLEAMACGLPVIATRIAGSEELVEHGVSGYLVNSEDVNSLKENLQMLFLNFNKAQTMGHASRHNAETYSWQKVAEQYSQYLKNILAQ